MRLISAPYAEFACASVATMTAGMRFAGSTEYSARGAVGVHDHLKILKRRHGRGVHKGADLGPVLADQSLAAVRERLPNLLRDVRNEWMQQSQRSIEDVERPPGP